MSQGQPLTDSHSFPTAKLALRPFELGFQHSTLSALHGLDRFGQQFHQLVCGRRHAGPTLVARRSLRDARVIGRRRERNVEVFVGGSRALAIRVN